MTRSPGAAGGLEPGLTGQPYDVPIEWGKVREFAWATKARSASYFDDREATAPPTFLSTATLWTNPQSGLLTGRPMNLARLLHGAQEFVFHGPPPRSGELLTARQHVESIEEKAGRRSGSITVTVVVTEFRDGAGTLVAEDRHTTVETSRPVSTDGEGGPSTASPSAEHGGPVGTDTTEQLPELRDQPLSRTDIVRYQGASGDLNPIHHDDEFAQRSGFPTAFSVGMLHAGILGTYLADLFGPENVRRYGVKFREQVWPGDVLVYGGRVVRRAQDPDHPTLDLEVFARKAVSGAMHLTGNATVVGASVPGT